MVSNGPLGIYLKTGMPQNGKQDYKLSYPNKQGEIETKIVKVDEKNVDKFDKLNVDCILAANEIGQKMKKATIIGAAIGGIAPLASFLAFAKNKWLGAGLGVVTGAIGAFAGMFTGSYISAKNVIPKAKQRIEENDRQMQALIEK